MPPVKSASHGFSGPVAAADEEKGLTLTGAMYVTNMATILRAKMDTALRRGVSGTIELGIKEVPRCRASRHGMRRWCVREARDCQ